MLKLISKYGVRFYDTHVSMIQEKKKVSWLHVSCFHKIRNIRETMMRKIEISTLLRKNLVGEIQYMRAHEPRTILNTTGCLYAPFIRCLKFKEKNLWTSSINKRFVSMFYNNCQLFQRQVISLLFFWGIWSIVKCNPRINNAIFLELVSTM